MRSQSERERDLLDRLMFATGNKWTNPPAQAVEPNQEDQKALEAELKRRMEGWEEFA